MQGLVSAFEHRGLRIGKAMYQELTGLKKPKLDKNNILHWPVILLYAEVMSSDIIEDFCETDMFSAHLDMISLGHRFLFPPSPSQCTGSISSWLYSVFKLILVILSFQTCSQMIAFLCPGIQEKLTLVALLSCTMRYAFVCDFLIFALVILIWAIDFAKKGIVNGSTWKSLW